MKKNSKIWCILLINLDKIFLLLTLKKLLSTNQSFFYAFSGPIYLQISWKMATPDIRTSSDLSSKTSYIYIGYILSKIEGPFNIITHGKLYKKFYLISGIGWAPNSLF